MVTGSWEMMTADNRQQAGRRTNDIGKNHIQPDSPRKRCWLGAVALLMLCCVCLLTALLSLLRSRRQNDQHSEWPDFDAVSSKEYMDAPLTPFSELSPSEVDVVLNYFADHHHQFHLKDVKEATVSDNFIHLMEAVVPPKDKVLSYLQHGGPMPGRKARIILFMGNATPPVVEEYELLLSTRPLRARLVRTDSRKTRIPYSHRPFSRVEFRAIFSRLVPIIKGKLGTLLKESYGGATLGPGCKPKCLRLSMTPVSSAFLPPLSRAAWFWLAYDREYFTLHPVDLQFLVNTTHTDSSQWAIERVFYANQYFDSFEELERQYGQKVINVTRLSFPAGPEEELYSSLHLRGDPFPEDGRPPPVSVQPEGHRFNVRGSRVDFMLWHFTLRVSPTIGLQLFDINFGAERIAYEISLQEVAVLYSGHSPASSVMYFADSAGLFGTRMRGMLKGHDCPHHAVYLDTRMFTSNDGGLRHFKRAMCLFEHNSQSALRRHRAYSMSGAFYGGLTDSYLVLRTITSLINYDYIIDYNFHVNGAIEVRISSTGYLSTTFYLQPEERYGSRVHDHVMASMHQHLFHLKVDFDIAGTRNTFSTLDVNVEKKKNVWSTDPSSPEHTQAYLGQTVMKREMDACYQYDFTAPKYLLVSGGNISSLGHRRSYRILPRGTSPPMLPPEDGFEPSVAWARCQVAVTRHKDSEASSTSIFAMWDTRDTVVNFTSYMADDEDIEEQDLVTWVTLGMYHIPHLEDTPNTATVGTPLSLFLLPFNYFPSDPSMASRDAVRVSPRDSSQPTAGAVVERYNTSRTVMCVPGNKPPSQELMEDSQDLFS